ncbi:hypothetical protein [Lysobacter sp. TY2-98]|uniref:hypothetical protein n=1 Tax=Lysobacter sp. TY2-98 TaxID=2290922 RepID=UPI0019656FEB|nr:hypothetical protein [Lysobacter sp. TY2-98]
MSTLDRLPSRMLDLASQAGDHLSHLGPRASEWLDAGAKLGALKTASKVGVKVVRRNPVIFGAALAGAGLLWYAARRRAKRAENGNGDAIEGRSRRIETRSGDEDSTPRTRTQRRTSTRRTSPSRARRESRTEH